MRDPRAIAKLCRDGGLPEQGCFGYLDGIDRHSDLCHEWNEEHDYYEKISPHAVPEMCSDLGMELDDCLDHFVKADGRSDLCREWGGNPSACDPEAGWNADRSVREDVCRMVCGF